MLVRLLTCFLIIAAVAVQRNQSIFGRDISGSGDAEASDLAYSDGTIVVNTTEIASGIKGYGGPVPLEITIKDNRIADITPLRNAESEAFFSKVREGLIPAWIGTDVADVESKEVDAISGATLSSRAVNATIKAGVAHAMDSVPAAPDAIGFDLSVRMVAVLLVVLCAAVLPLFVRNKLYRYVQLALNVAVLGFWSGTFLSYEVFVNYVANGMNVWHSIVWLLMLVVAFVYPYFGRKSHYCTWVCPLGSIQELAGKSVKYKVNIPPKVVKALTVFQECLWFALMFVMCAGLWFDWMNWELFTAFIFRSAATGVIVAAVLFVALSFVVMRPYCRFVCPTGCLFQLTQNPEK